MVERDYRTDSRPAKDNPDKNTAPLQSGGNSRTEAKRFIKEKGPRIARAAVTIGVFVFNVVSVCC